MSHLIIRFYVGHESAKDDVTPAQIRRAIDQLREDCASLWGGSTATEGEGMFHGDAGFYREACTVVETVAEVDNDPAADMRKGEKWIRLVSRKMAAECARGAGQECVMVTAQPVDVEFVSAR